MRGVILLLPLAACATKDAPADSGASVSSTETADTAVEEVPLPDPTWDADGALSQLNNAFSLGLADPTTLRDAFQGMWAGAGTSCPQVQGEYSMVMILSECTTDAGYTYGGVSTYEEEENGGFWLLGDGEIEDADGQVFTAAGELELEVADGAYSARLTGIWGYPGSDVSWAAQTPGLALWMSGGPATLLLDGSYGIDDVDIFFEEVSLADACTSGRIWLRDPQGSWYILTLDDACDGCGALSYGEDELGEICVSVEPAMADLARRME